MSILTQNKRGIKEITSAAQMVKLADKWRTGGESIGCVPTMGCLHEGHLSLVSMAKAENKRVVVTIFVNPIQFAQGEDLGEYPRTLREDIEKLEKEGVDCVFIPTEKEMYPSLQKTFVNVEGLTDNLCGKSRKSHFRGVTTVVAKLFNMTKPHRAYFGQKDYQQYTVIRRMAIDLNFDIEIKIGRIVRDKVGLALSSRNSYLSPDERKKAASIYRSLMWAKKEILDNNCSLEEIKSKASKIIIDAGGKVDYFEIVDSKTLEEKKEVSDEMAICTAVFFGSTRLIDNCLVNLACISRGVRNKD